MNVTGASHRPARRESGASPEPIDVASIVRGASTAFTILVIGGLMTVVVAGAVPVLGYVWLPVVAAVAFAVAGWRATTPSSPVLQGALAALGGYLLALPLVLFGTGEIDPVQVSSTVLTAVVVGTAAVLLRRFDYRRRARGAAS
ncbi:hypothetical protein H0B56_13220 [Haloechinothrix sp. YIM 98757]|uniref:Uncharacterized protein n=1 Tax=Haloechinothrix aidingensis TaxID=2752311 RepID=A0A838ABC2_9PSEU|nr:hypothetical protein [Haloechinothrix aidingensis]MBA0126505.1 hypothetical protein [Haloechinothrix aidingensis]